MIITQTPLRISLLGGNTDFPEYFKKYGGLVLTTTIDKYIYCIVNERKFDNDIRVNYSIKEIVKNVDELKHDLVREALKLLRITKGIEISFISDIPTKGTGLGSSSAVTVGALNALHNYLGSSVSVEQIVKEAIKIEVDILKNPIGVQDQYAVALGGLRSIEFKKSGRIMTEKLNASEELVEDLDNSLMLFYTGLSRESKDVLASLNIASDNQLIHQSKLLAKKGINSIKAENIGNLGILLEEYWKSKKALSQKISSGQIDKMHSQALAAGAIGGKIVGAGGGGFLLLMVPENKRSAVRQKLKSYKELLFRISNFGSRVILNT